MRVLYIGAGFVGTCSAAVMADSGHDVLVYDIDEGKIKMLASYNRELIELCLFEKGLGELLVTNKERIKFTANYDEVIKFLDEVDVIFMCLPTPEKKDARGESDISYIVQATEKLAEHLSKRNNGTQEKYVVIANKSTVPIKMVDEVERIMTNFGVKNFGVVSNPEFLVEGKAIENSIRPDRIVVGAKKEQDFEVMRNLYRRFYDSPTTTYIETNPYEAAAGKLMANFLLFNRLVTTYGVVGRLCEIFPEISFENLRKIITTDKRIGSWGFYNSLYAGGSCLIKDAASLDFQLEKAGIDVRQIKQVLAMNQHQRDYFYSRAKKEANFSWEGKCVAVMGVAFKRDTNDIRNSAAIDIVRYLVDDGAKEIRLYDPAATVPFKRLFDINKDERYEKIVYCNREDEALKGSNACIIVTDWPQFRSLGEKIKVFCPPPYLIMDGRRMIQHYYDELVKDGYSIIAVGSPYLTKS